MENKLSPLQQALLDSVLAEYAHVSEEGQIDYIFSQKFEKWAKKFIAETDHPAPKGRLSKTVKVLIIVAAIIALLAACAVAIPALREGLVDFFLTEKTDHYGVTFNPDQAAYAPDQVDEYITPSYVPEGFELILDDKSFAAVVLVWTNEKGEIISYNQVALRKDATQDDWIGFNSEGVERSSAIICGYKVEILQDVDMYTVIWTDNEYLYFMEIANTVDLAVFEKMLSSMMIVGTGAYGITFNPDMAANAPRSVEEYRIPQYVPEEFFLSLEDKNAATVFLAWMNETDDIITYHQTIFRQDPTNDNWIGFSTEGAERSSAVIYGYKVEILQYIDMYTVIWTDNEYLYYMDIPNSVSLTEFEKMLSSVAVDEKAYGITFDLDQAALAPHEILEYHIPQYAPDGYTICAEDKTPAIVTVIWINDAGNVIVYNQNFIPDSSTNDNWIGINSEDVIRSSAIISGCKVEIITEQDVYTAVWTDNMYLYMITLPNSLNLTVFEQILNSITVVS